MIIPSNVEFALEVLDSAYERGWYVAPQGSDAARAVAGAHKAIADFFDPPAPAAEALTIELRPAPADPRSPLA